LDKFNTAQVGCGHETSQIAHHAAAEGDNERFPFQTVAGQLVAAGLNHLEILGGFTGGDGDQDGIEAGFFQGSDGGFGVEGRDMRVGNNRASPAQAEFGALGAEGGQKFVPD
jgi:hypothetical protein